MAERSYNYNRGLANADLKHEVRTHLLQVQKAYGLSLKEMRKLLTERPEPRSVPLSVFRKELGIIEAVVQYLIDIARLKPAMIADLLNRSETTIRNSYRASKLKAKVEANKNTTRIPVKIFSSREQPPLPTLIIHLKSRGWRLADIARALHRDPRNINTSYGRYKQ